MLSIFCRTNKSPILSSFVLKRCFAKEGGKAKTAVKAVAASPKKKVEKKEEIKEEQLPLGFAKDRQANLYDVLIDLPDFGVGQKIARKSWAPFGNSYWTIVKSRVEVKKNVVTGKAWGTLTWKGVEEPRVRTIGGSHKRLWQNPEAKTTTN